MSCYKDRCDQPSLNGSQAWGLGGVTCCAEHMEVLMDELSAGKQVERSFLEDYAKIKIMMVEQASVKRCLMKLAGELGEIVENLHTAEFAEYRPQHPQEGYIRLSAALEKYEQYCWFPPSHEIFIGFVPSGSFNLYIARGIMAKDPGAGLEHGDFTHRLHWHAISRVITNDFTVAKIDSWNHSPLELYTSLGRGQALAVNMWFNLLDDAQQKNFTSPDALHAEVRKPEYGILGVNVARRYAKRQEEYNVHFDEQVYKEKYELRGMADVPDPRFPGTPATITQHQKYAKLDVPAMAGQAYSDRKEQRYKRVGNLPIVKRKEVDDPLTIEGRIGLSKTLLNKTAADNKDVYSVVYDKRLGMISRGLGKRTTDLKQLHDPSNFEHLM